MSGTVSMSTANSAGTVAALERTLRMLHEDGATFEIRAPKTRFGTISGYYTASDAARAARDVAVQLDRAEHVPAVYTTLNPVMPDLRARADAQLKHYQQSTTADAEILRRRWLLIDCDPKRPHGVSATDAEHAAAFDVAGTVRALLDSLGWPAPVVADSGNGAHLLYRVDLPNDEAATALCKCALEGLADTFSTEQVLIDRTTYNAARITKFYGSLARKGSHTPDLGRVHRRSALLEVPNPVDVASTESLSKVAKLLAPTMAKPPDYTRTCSRSGTTATSSGTRSATWIEDAQAYLDQHGVAYRERPSNGTVQRRFVLEQCPFSTAHRDGAVVLEFANGGIAARCMHNSCAGKGLDDLRDAVEGRGWRQSSRRAQDTTSTSASSVSKDDHKGAHSPGHDHLRREAGHKPAIHAESPKDDQLGRPEHLRDHHSDGQGDSSAARDDVKSAAACWDGGNVLNDLTPEQVQWLWNGYIPFGKLTIADGDPGLGKTMVFAADLAARVTTGQAMPDGTRSADLAVATRAGRDCADGGAGVLIFTAEDDPADTLLPRLLAAGGDPRKVVAVTTITRPSEEPGQPDVERLPTFSDLDLIRRKIAQVKAKLVIFDPLMAYLPSGTNAYRDHEVRAVLAPLAHLAVETGVAIVLIRHLTKGDSPNALYRGGGSIGIIGAARSGLAVVQDPDDERVRVFGSIKSNLGAPVPSLTYTIAEHEQMPSVAHIVWGEQPSPRSVKELLASSGARAREGFGSSIEDASAFLREVLTDGASGAPTPKPQTEIETLAVARGVSRSTLNRAKKLLGVTSHKEGFGRDSVWIWSLPWSSSPTVATNTTTATVTKDTQSKRVEHLSTNPGVTRVDATDIAKDDQRVGYEHLSASGDHLWTKGDLDLDLAAVAEVEAGDTLPRISGLWDSTLALCPGTPDLRHENVGRAHAYEDGVTITGSRVGTRRACIYCGHVERAGAWWG